MTFKTHSFQKKYLSQQPLTQESFAISLFTSLKYFCFSFFIFLMPEFKNDNKY